MGGKENIAGDEHSEQLIVVKKEPVYIVNEETFEDDHKKQSIEGSPRQAPTRNEQAKERKNVKTSDFSQIVSRLKEKSVATDEAIQNDVQKDRECVTKPSADDSNACPTEEKFVLHETGSSNKPSSPERVGVECNISEAVVKKETIEEV